MTARGGSPDRRAIMCRPEPPAGPKCLDGVAPEDPTGDHEMNRFQKLSLATTAMTLFLIGSGGTVRASGSGLACPDWPRGHGRGFPPPPFHQIVEDSHPASGPPVSGLGGRGA